MKKFVKVIYNFSTQMKEDNLNSYASSCAFFIFLSLIPLMMLFLAILPYTPIKPALITDWLTQEFPAGTGTFLVSIFDEVSEKSISAISITAIATLWSAGKAIYSLIAGFNAIDKYVDKRNWIVLRAIACLYTLVFLIGIIVVLILVVGGNFLMEHILGLFPNTAEIFKILLHFRTLITIVLMTVIFMLCYSLLPYKKHKLKEQFPGAVFSSLVWVGFSFLFSFYVNRFNAFSMYGSLTTIIVLMVWLYFDMYILFIGDNLNKYFSPVIKVLFTKGRKIKDVKGEFQNFEK